MRRRFRRRFFFGPQCLFAIPGPQLAAVHGAAFVTFSGYYGFQILYIAGVEEVEVSVGIGHTVVQKLQ